MGSLPWFVRANLGMLLGESLMERPVSLERNCMTAAIKTKVKEMKLQKYELEKVLSDRFSLSRFRQGQFEIISEILQKKDVLAVLPTGGGKSLCYQLPAIVSNKLVLVISPLIALMRDQVASLKKLGIPAGALHSNQSEDEKRAIFQEMNKGEAFVLYISPERASKEGFHKWIQGRDLAMFAIDEAHCVSQWGHDFREEYAQLDVLKKMRPEVPMLALTASATPTVLQDVAKQLGLKSPQKMVHGFYRPNLYYQVEACVDDDAKLAFVRQALQQTPDGRVIIYCGTRKVTEELARVLAQSSDKVGFYHAGLPGDERTKTQEAYARGDLRVLVATNAFGMGIDQPDVRLVIHYQMPGNIDSLYQEMGRAGRDGKDSTCLMLYSKRDKGLQSFFIESSEAPEAIKSARWRNLDMLVNYAEGGECRHAEILTYYKDAQRINRCGHCDSCLPVSQRRVVVVESKKSTESKAPKFKTRKASSNRGVVVELDLNEEQELRFQSLRQWRRQKSQELDCAAFVIFTDKTLKQLALKNPRSLDELRKIPGIGETKLEKFGWDLLAIST